LQGTPQTKARRTDSISSPASAHRHRQAEASLAANDVPRHQCSSLSELGCDSSVGGKVAGGSKDSDAGGSCHAIPFIAASSPAISRRGSYVDDPKADSVLSPDLVPPLLPNMATSDAAMGSLEAPMQRIVPSKGEHASSQEGQHWEQTMSVDEA